MAFIISYMSKSMTALLFCMLTCFAVFTSYAGIKPTRLTCEYLKNPSVVDILQPRLAWVNLADDNERGQNQTAFQVKVASEKEQLKVPDLWESGKIISEQSIRVKYQGEPLRSGQVCWWQVRVWDKNGTISEWSRPAFWRMGILNPEEWKAKWIGSPWQGEEPTPKPLGGPDATLKVLPPPAPMFRKEVTLERKVESAVVFVTGLGYFEFFVNGEKIGKDVLVPNQTNYGKRLGLKNAGISLEDNFKDYKVMYLGYDITNRLNKGENVFGTIVGNGFYNPAKFWTEAYGSPRFLAQIHIKYSDGTEDVIISDESWKTAQCPIRFDMVYYGEIYDARHEQAGWCSPGFNDDSWENAALRQAPGGRLVAHTALTDRVTKRIFPKSIEKTEKGTYKVDFGVEISGWVRLKNITGQGGHKIDIEFNSNYFSGSNSYILSGKGNENYAPRFNWFVFSSVEVYNWPGELKKGHIVAEMVNTDVEETARFSTSNKLFNKIHSIWEQSQLDNMHGGVVSDCPHRERSPYIGDGQVACVTVMHNYDASAFYQKWIADIRDAQNIETGYVPNGAPWQPGCGGGMPWGAAICIMPWEFYLHYGARDMLEDSYGGMKAYTAYLQSLATTEGILYTRLPGRDGQPLKWLNLGEWEWPENGEQVTDSLVHTYFYWRCIEIVSKTAKALNLSNESKQYALLAEKIKKAFQDQFYNQFTGSYGKGGGNIFALKMGVPATQYERVITALKTDIEQNGGHLDTGIFGTQLFFEVLADHGMQDLAYNAMNKKTAPGFGHWIEQGATTTWESWINNGNKRSNNHPMFGGALTWFYRKLSGMNVDPENPGYRHIIFKPQPVSHINNASYFNQTSYGEAGIAWEQHEGRFWATINVPVGCTATIYLPAANCSDIKENGMSVISSSDTMFKRMEKGYVILHVKSGVYHFESYT